MKTHGAGLGFRNWRVGIGLKGQGSGFTGYLVKGLGFSV